eukprot:UN26233
MYLAPEYDEEYRKNWKRRYTCWDFMEYLRMFLCSTLFERITNCLVLSALIITMLQVGYQQDSIAYERCELMQMGIMTWFVFEIMLLPWAWGLNIWWESLIHRFDFICVVAILFIRMWHPDDTENDKSNAPALFAIRSLRSLRL